MCCLLAPGSAWAHGPSNGELAAALLIAAGDLAFVVGDVVAFANDERDKVWLIPQAIFTTPQAASLNVLAYLEQDTPVGIAMFGDQVATFAIYGLANPELSTTALYPLSWAIGSNLALTNNAFALSLHSKLSSKAVATTEITAAVPQLVVAGFALGSPSNFPSQRPVLLALGGWSAALFTHGAMSLIFRHAAADAHEPPEAGFDFHLTPGMVTADRQRAPGVFVHGKF